jgi:hypothetical protein
MKIRHVRLQVGKRTPVLRRRGRTMVIVTRRSMGMRRTMMTAMLVLSDIILISL